MLIIMKNRNVHSLFESFFYFKTFRGFNIFKINATKRWF